MPGETVLHLLLSCAARVESRRFFKSADLIYFTVRLHRTNNATDCLSSSCQHGFAKMAKSKKEKQQTLEATLGKTFALTRLSVVSRKWLADHFQADRG